MDIKKHHILKNFYFNILKKSALYIMLMGLFSMIHLKAQAQSSTLTTQTEVNNFRGTLNGSTSVTGNLIVGASSDITDLSPLDFLTEITGNFDIRENSALKSIEDFPALKKIGGRCLILNHDSLETVNGFSVLDSIGENFWISGNKMLNGLGDYDSLRHIQGNFIIGDEFDSGRPNPFLKHMGNFPVLTTIEGYYWIHDNDMLVNGNIVPMLESIGGYFLISNNDALTNVGSFPSLTTVGEYISIIHNNNLRSLYDIHALTSIGESSSDGAKIPTLNNAIRLNAKIVVDNNPSLEDCCVLTKFRRGEAYEDSGIYVSNNAAGCNNPGEAICNPTIWTLRNTHQLPSHSTNTAIIISSNTRWRLRKSNSATDWITMFSNENTSVADNLEENFMTFSTTTVTITHHRASTSTSRSAELTLVAIGDNGHELTTPSPIMITLTQLGIPPYPNDVALATQAEVNNFRSILNGATAIAGNLTIGPSSDITDLRPLNFLTEITGNFEIGQDGMTNGVPNGNSALVDIGDFPFLQKIGGRYYVTQNTNLVNGGNFPVLEKIGGVFFIRDNDKLESMGTFPRLKSIGAYVSIRSNGILPSLYDFPALTSIGMGSPWVPSVSSTTNNPVDNVSIIVENNDSLQYCCVLRKFNSNGTYPVSGGVYVNNNATEGCDEICTFLQYTGNIVLRTQQAVDTIRATLGDPRITILKGGLTIGPSNDITDLSPLNFLTEVTGNFFIDNNSALVNVDSFPVLKKIGYLLIRTNANLEDAGDFPVLERIETHVEISTNDNLKNAGDFPVLEKIGGIFLIELNNNLEDLGDFPELDSIGGFYAIANNIRLTNVGYFPSLTTIGQYFSIRGNDNLRYLYEFPELTSIGNGSTFFLDGTFSILLQDNSLLKYCCVLTKFRSGGAYQVSDNVLINRNAMGCNGTSEANCDPFVDLSKGDTLMLPYNSVDTTFTIVSNARWQSSKQNADEDWITMLSAGEESSPNTIMGGQNGELTYNSVTVNYHLNGTDESRAVNLLASFLDDMNVATLSDTLTLMQEAKKNILQLQSPSEVNVSDSADNTDIHFRSNVGWRLSKPEGASWITNFSDGTTSNTDTLEVNIRDEKILATTTTVTISYEETPTSASRSAELVLVAIDENGHVIETFHPVTITITQAGFPSHTGDITLINQQAVNTIRNTLSNPRITAIKGNLIIGHSSDITDLSPLDFLTEITGNFEIGQNGMTNGVPNGNSALVDIGDFPFLQKIGGGYYVTQNTNLVNGGNFPVLDSIGGYFFIRDNDKLESVGFFPRLKDIGTYFSIRSNEILLSLYDFPALTSIGTGNPYVPSEGIETDSTSIVIENNSLLAYCCVLTKFRSGGIYPVPDSIYIKNNAMGCNSDSQASCDPFVAFLQTDTLQVSFHTTDTTFTIVSNARWRLNKPNTGADWVTMLSAGEESSPNTIMGGQNGELTYTSVTVSYHQNNTITSRKVNLFLSFLDMNVATLDDTLTLMQEATSNVLQLLSPSEVNVSDSADNTDIAIRSNVGWRLSKPEGVNWITNFSDGTTSNADTLEVNIGVEKILATTTTVTISYEETPTSASRSAELVLVAIDENGHVIETFHPVTITITQAGFPSHTGDITLINQQAVNTIRNTLSNPRITAIKGNLIIGHSSDITDLSPLDFLTEITGNFEIGQNGMTNGVPNGNSALVDIGDFPFLQKIGGGYYVTQNAKLVNGGNFPVLDSIGGYFFIRDNDKLESVGTFPRLKDIGTYFSMRSNGILPSLYDFPALTSIGTGSAWVPSSNSGNGSTVDSVSIVVENNSLLAHCCVLTKFRMNDDIVQDSISISGSIHISGNVSGCNSTSDASCNSFVTFLQTDTLQVSFHTTDTTFTIVSNARWRLNKPNTGADWVTMLSAGEESSPNTIMGGQNGELTYTSVTVSYHQNSTDESRTGNLLVSFLDDMNVATLDDTLILMQEAKNNILQLQPPNKVEVSHSSGSTDIHFRSNVRWRLRKPQDATWMTLSAENTITSGGNLMGDDNEVLASRVNVVTLSYEELPADTLHRNIVLVLEALDENGNVLDTPPANTLMFTQSIPPYTGSITLLNQEQVNNIHTRLGDPRITAIKGNLTIGSSVDITDLSPLNFLTEITGNFKIGINSGNIALVDIGDFPVLRRIGGNFEIRSNNKLEDAGDFPVLERIGNNFEIRFNSKLENVVGFPELNSIKGNFFISDNNNLKDMGDFPELDSIGGYFLMRFNPQLERVGSFSSLVDIGGYFEIKENDSLRYLYDFPALMTINRTNSAAEKVVITNNPLLEYCCVLTKFRSDGIYPVSPDSVLVNNNATGCNSIDEANCDPLVTFLQTDTLQVPFYTTDTTFMIVSNSRWRLSADTGWVEMLSVGGTSHSDSVMGGKNGELTYTSVTVSYHQNNTITSRKVNLFLSFLDMNVATLSDTLTLMQEATSNVLQLLSPSEVNVSHSSGSTEIRFRSNVRWRLRKPQDATWMTLSAENAITTSEGNLMTDDNADIEATFTVVTLSYEELPTSASRSIPLVLEALDGNGNVLNVPPSSTLMFTQSVLPYIGNITLRTQQAVDTIHATLGDPRITVITGSLIIVSSSNITDLSPLNFLTEVTGNFIIDDNSALIDMGDFPVLQKIGGNYHVIQNDNLINVGRFPELDSIGGYFEIEENIKLENVGHFPSLVDIGKYFSVNANDSLRYLYDFPALMTIRGGGASLPFEVMVMEEIKIVVADNPSLEYCCVLTKFRLDGTYPVSDSAYISGNATMSCNSVNRASCDPFVDLSKGNTLMLPDTPSNFDFTVSSNGRWKLIQSGETVDWVTLSIGDNTIANDFIGGINTTITRTPVRVNHSQNELYNARTVNLLIVFLDKMGNEINSSNPDTLTIIQEENQIPKITLTSHTDGENDSIAYDNTDTITLNFTLEGSATNSISNISYTPENANFITLQPENNNEATRTITITPTANTTTEQRTATITLNTTGHEGTPDNVSLTITQTAEPTIILTSHTSGENITIAHDNTNSITLDFILGGISNFMSSISYMPENANFITSQRPSNDDEIISIMIAPSANTTTEQRTATITVNTTGHKGTPASVSLTITQETVPTLILTSKRTDSIIHNDTETKNIDFTVGGSATGWISDIVYTPRNTNFITLSPEEDTTQTGSITIMASPIENTDNENRMATITLSTRGHLGTPARDTFTIVQKAKPTIILRNNNSSIQKDHTTPIVIRFTVGGSANGWASHIDYIPENTNFITLNPTQNDDATGNITIRATPSANASVRRTATIILITAGHKGTPDSVSLTITQAAGAEPPPPTLGISASKPFTLYPNPTNGTLTIEGVTGYLQMYIHDLVGREVMTYSLTPSKKTIDVSDLPSGMYVVTLQGEDKTWTEILIIVNG